jgi:hypothetical protein
LACRTEREAVDLVQEQRALVSLLEQSRVVRERAGERSTHVAEEQTLHQLVRCRRHVVGDEGMIAARSAVVQRPREQLLAAAGLALHQRHLVAPRQQRHQLANPPHRR